MICANFVFCTGITGRFDLFLQTILNIFGIKQMHIFPKKVDT